MLCASRQLDTLSERAEITNDADIVLAKIRTPCHRRGGGEENEEIEEFVELTRTQLTSAFAHNTGRPSAMTTERLYSKVIPNLIERGLAALGKKRGVFLFRLNDHSTG